MSREKYEARLSQLGEQVKAASSAAEDRVMQAMQAFPDLDIRPKPEAYAAAQEAREKAERIKREYRDRVKSVPSETVQALSQARRQQANLEYTIKALERQIASTADPSRVAELRAALNKQRPRVPAAKARTESAQAAYDAAIGDPSE